jgi:hypothetical protein
MFKWRVANYVSTSLLFALGPGIYASPGDAADNANRPPIIDEFFLTETVQAQERGEFQLTVRAIADKDDDEGDTNTALIGLEYGITDSLQIEAAWVAWRQVKAVEDDESDRSGHGDMEVGIKYTFDENEATGVRVAVGFDVIVPLGDVNNDLGEGFWVYEPFLVVSKEFGESTNLTNNLSYGFLDRDEYPDDIDEAEPEADEIELNVGLVHVFAPAWRGTLEAILETNEQSSKGDETIAYLSPGFIYKGMQEVEMGLAMPVGLTNDSADWGFIGMLSVEF